MKLQEIYLAIHSGFEFLRNGIRIPANWISESFQFKPEIVFIFFLLLISLYLANKIHKRWFVSLSTDWVKFLIITGGIFLILFLL